MDRLTPTKGSRLHRVSGLLPATAAILLALATFAHAGSDADDAWRLWDKAGISYGSPGQAIAAANSVCELRDAGTTADETAWQLVITNPGLTSDTASKFAGIAASVYGPQYSNRGGTGAE